MKQATAFIVAVSLTLCANLADLGAQESSEPIKGKLDLNDPPDPFLKKVSMGKLVTPHKIHTMKFDPNKIVVIDLMSSDFDAFLRVEDAKGTLLAVDDDGGEGLNSRTLFSAPKKGDYRVVVSSLNKRPGNYTLSIKAAPKNVIFARSGILEKQAEIQNVKLQKGKTYVINLKGSFDTFLKVNDATGKQLAEDDDGGEGFNARLSFTAPESATYQIVATSFMGQGKGPYQLTIEEK